MKRVRTFLIMNCILSTVFAGTVLAAATPSNSVIDTKKLDQIVESAMAEFQVPGLAIAVVSQDKLLLAKGYGVRDIGNNKPVTAQTLFGIASNTKAFTTAALAMLVDQGKLSWDDPVIKHIPEFQLADPYVSREMTIRDLLSHRSGLGLGAGDLLIWPDTDKSTSEIISALRFIKPASSFRSKYAYNNLMFVVAGEVVARVSGQSWQEYVEQQMFRPIGMNTTAAGYSRIAANNDNRAVGHIPMNNQLQRYPLDYLEDFRGAGAIASNVAEMSLWLRTQLAHGVMPSGERLFSEAQQQQMWQQHITTNVSAESFKSTRQQFAGYGLGWSVDDYFGYKRLSHGGGILGMVSQVTLIPEKQLGIVILTNQQAFPAINAISREVLEQALALPDTDWVKELGTKYHQYRAKVYQQSGPVKLAHIQPALANVNYVGLLQSDWYGEVNIEEIDGKLRIRFSHTPKLQGWLVHHSGNRFVVQWDDKLMEAEAYIDFVLNAEQQLQSATMQLVNPDITDFSFDFHDLTLNVVKPKA
jgi:CubicO group peptidase (beta-lactamase class C family)